MVTMLIKFFYSQDITLILDGRASLGIPLGIPGLSWYSSPMLVYLISNTFIVTVISGDFNVREVSLTVDLGAPLTGHCTVQ